MNRFLMIQTAEFFVVFFLLAYESLSFVIRDQGKRVRTRNEVYRMIEYPIIDDIDTKTFEVLKKDHPLSPPEYLQDLEMNQSITPIPSLPDLTVTRLSKTPDIFLLKNILSNNQADQIIKYASNTNMDYSGTKSGGAVKQRMNSYSCWIRQNEDEFETSPAHSIAQYMIEISSMIFISDIMKTLQESTDELLPRIGYDAEPMQVVKYKVGGSFDVHHDGFSRFLTVLTYLNGVAGTWFPYAIVDESESYSDQLEDSEIPDMRSTDVIKEKRPGRDGLVIVSQKDASFEDYSGPGKNHVVRVNRGDAIVFYNYDWIVKLHQGEIDDVPDTGPLINWRSIHSGLHTQEEKWIATNWFQILT